MKTNQKHLFALLLISSFVTARENVDMDRLRQELSQAEEKGKIARKSQINTAKRLEKTKAAQDFLSALEDCKKTNNCPNQDVLDKQKIMFETDEHKNYVV